jgi:hypothetical protein
MVKDIVSVDHSLKWWKWGGHVAEMGDEVLLNNWGQINTSYKESAFSG